MATSSDDSRMLNLVIRYKMTKQEAMAWRVAILYLKTSREHFPAYQQPRTPKGDPRKSILFKYCYKLVSDRGDQLKPHEYRLYVRAQMEILKVITSPEGVHGLIGPHCLVGDKAWGRWMVWRRKLEEAPKQSSAAVVVESDSKAMADLEKTKEFLVSKGVGSRSEAEKALSGRAVARWLAIRRVSPFYVVLSPLAAKWLSETGQTMLGAFGVDPKLYPVSDALRSYFLKTFSHEFST